MTKLSIPSRNMTKGFNIEDLEVKYKTEHRRVKYPRLEFKTDRLLVILPQNIKDEHEILNKKKEWIYKKQKIINEAIKSIPIGGKKNFLILGEPFKTTWSKNFHFIQEGREIKIDFTNKIHTKLFRNILKKMLIEKIEKSIFEYSKRLKTKPNKIFIKQQKTKWASCSNRGNLSFNLKLISISEKCLKYVVLHELLHLKEPKHNNNFKRIIEKEFMDYEKMERLLLEYWFYLEKYQVGFYS